MSDFQKDLENLINHHNIDGESNTPDYVLASYLMTCLDNYHAVISSRDGFYDFHPEDQMRFRQELYGEKGKRANE